MNQTIQLGDSRVYEKIVMETDIAQFNGQVVHRVCSTFALAQAVEYAARLFVLDLKRAEEEGIGIRLLINHENPAFIGETIVITAQLTQHEHNTVLCTFVAKVGERVVATGETGQKILKKEKLAKLLNLNRA